MGGVFAIHALLWPAKSEVARASLIGFLLLATHSVLFGIDTGHAHCLAGLMLYYQGLGSLVSLAWRAWCSCSAPEGRRALVLLMAGGTLPLFVIASSCRSAFLIAPPESGDTGPGLRIRSLCLGSTRAPR